MKFFKGPGGEVVSSNGSKAADGFVDTYARICQEAEDRKREWISTLRFKGVKAAHPDDGWVDRVENSVILAYPQFNDGVHIEDLIALGDPEKWRIVKILEIKESNPIMGNVIYSFREEKYL